MTVLDLIERSGFEYIDIRQSGGALWIVVGEAEAKKLIEECEKKGFKFQFTQSGGRQSKHRPAWYTKDK